MEVIGICSESAFSGQVIFKVDNMEERVLSSYQWEGVDGTEQTRPTWSKIRYNMKGQPYFMARNHRYYLSEFIRTNYGRA